MMVSNEPPYLPIGTDVSAKYRGAFCEAKVKKIAKAVKCKVFVKEIQSSLVVTDEFVTGNLVLGNVVEVRHPDTGRIMEGIINKMFDTSMYTVIFDDGDERTLRRSQLCLKGDKHFIESETLDNLPLSNPEQFGTPVIGGKGKRRSSGIGSGTQDESEESSEDELSDSQRQYSAGAEFVGKVMFYDIGEKKRQYLLPVLTVVPEAHPTTLKSKDHLLVKSFKDNKFLSVLRKDLIPFAREIVLKNEDKTLKIPMEKALLYIDNRELPASWNKEELFGPDYDSDFDEQKSDEDNEPSEEEDRFVAQLYKFCDDRGTPINKAPSVGSKDLNLYKLFKIVQNLGGYNRVTNQMKWRLVYSKMLLPPSNTASTQIKNAYKKYLHAFEDFYRKLGSTMGTISRPGRSRHDSGRGILNFRGRDKEALAKEAVTREAAKEAAKEALKEAEKTVDTSKDETKTEKMDDSAVEPEPEAEPVSTPIGTPKRPKSARLKTEPKLISDQKEVKTDKKEKKDANKKEDQKAVKKSTESNQDKNETKEAKENEKELKKEEAKDEEKKDKIEGKKNKTELRKDKDEGKKDKSEAKKDKDEGNDKGEGKNDKDEGKKEKDEGKKSKDVAKKDKDDGKKDKDEEKDREEVKQDKEGKKNKVEGKKDKDVGKKDKDVGKKDKDEGKNDKAEVMKDEGKREVEKKEVKVKVVRKEAEEDKDTKDPLKKSVRRRITRMDEESEEKKEKKEGLKDEVKPKKNEQKETEKEVQKPGGKEEKKVVKKDLPKSAAKKEEKAEKMDEDETPTPAPVASGLSELPVGTKLRVRYGRGRNQREYEAKIIEAEPEGSHRQYLVHYQGWNNRHDEWIKPERIVKVLEKPESKVKAGLKPSPKFLKKPVKKKLLDKSPASPSSVASSDSGVTPATRGRPPLKSKSPASSALPPNKGRPTRSNSVEQMVVTGLHLTAKRRAKKSVERMDTSKGSESEESDRSDAEEELHTETEKKDLGKNAMPSIADAVVSEKTSEELEDNKDLDRSPPQLSKVTDIVKDKVEEDEKVEVKPELKESDEPAPILNVMDREKSNEPILQKMEAQLTSSSPSSIVTVEIKEKDAKKKDAVEKKPKKGLFKWEPEESVKKVEKVAELKVPPVVSKVPEESPYEFKDETEFEPDFHRERKKPIVLMEDCRKESPRKDSPRKESPRRSWHENEGSNLLQKIEKEEVGIVPVVKVNDFSKSDSEVEKVEKVERRGRKRKDVKERELKEKELREKEMKIMQDNIRKGKQAQADKTIAVTETKVTSSPEKRAFITLAEKKQVYSPNLKCASEIQLENAVVQKPSADSSAENKEEHKKQTDNVVVHKALDAAKSIDIEAGKRSERVPESGVSTDLMTPVIVKDETLTVNAEEKEDSTQETEKKKVRKKPKKKISREEELINLYGPKKKLGGRRRRNTDTNNQEKEVVETSANNESKSDIDLRCDEKIRSRSASPESKKLNVNIADESQGFGPLFEAMECKLKESQQNQESAISREYKQTPFKGNLFENTPPSTPEHDSDGASQNSQEHVKLGVSNSAIDTNSKLSVCQPVGSESPWGIGNTSPSSGSSGVVASSEGSIDIVVTSTKRRRESVEPTPTKRRKRVSRNKSLNRSKPPESDSEEASNLSAKCRSPHYSSDSYGSKSHLANRNRSPRPPKYNFNLEEGKYLEGNQRISFLVDKIQEIRKIYMSLKTEVAGIDRRRKRARRREKERESARTGSSGEAEFS